MRKHTHKKKLRTPHIQRARKTLIAKEKAKINRLEARITEFDQRFREARQNQQKQDAEDRLRYHEMRVAYLSQSGC